MPTAVGIHGCLLTRSVTIWIKPKCKVTRFNIKSGSQALIIFIQGYLLLLLLLLEKAGLVNVLYLLLLIFGRWLEQLDLSYYRKRINYLSLLWRWSHCQRSQNLVGERITITKSISITFSLLFQEKLNREAKLQPTQIFSQLPPDHGIICQRNKTLGDVSSFLWSVIYETSTHSSKPAASRDQRDVIILQQFKLANRIIES